MIASRRCGACPGLAEPMPTGDGLLARLRPLAPLLPAALAGLAAAARSCGNGIVEVTARGSLQVRGLDAATAPRFAGAVADLDIAVADGVAVVAGFDGAADGLAVAVRQSVGAAGLTLSPKVCVVVDGGGALHLDGLAADVRVRAGSAGVHVGIAADGRDRVAWLGAVPAAEAPTAVTAILRLIAAVGPAARGADVLAGTGVEALRAVLGLAPSEPPPPRRPAAVVGLHAMDGTAALGIALAFGYARAEALEDLAARARRVGVAAVRPVPGRALLLTGAFERQARELMTAAAALGFVIDPADPRRAVAACPGAPACASGLIAARRIAAEIAPLIPTGADGVLVHVSGCPKGCAHPRPAPLTLVGHPHGCAVVPGGTAAGAPRHVADPARLGAVVTAFVNGSLTGQTTMAGAYLRDGAAIYARSFAIIRAEADLSGFSAAEAEVAVRMIHACGQVDAARHIRFGDGVIAAARTALAGGAPVLCDAAMVAHGITRARLPAHNEVACTLNDPRVPEIAARLGTTRSAAALELWGDRLGGAVVAIGNAPTALFRLLELLDSGAPRPAAIVGIPVGFVGAAESKEALMNGGHGIPWLAVRGRMGGSAMTAAAVNALARAGL